jgi:putative ABC transport system permease protein
MQSFWQDVRYGLRMLAKNPGFSVVAVLTLALGIGANTAIFSLTDQVLLRRLPVAHPDQLVVLSSPGPNPGRTWADGDPAASFSYLQYKDIRDRNDAFTSLLARFALSVSVAGQGQSELANGELVSGNYFETLGVQPALGRVFNAQDETAPDANSLAVLSYGYWKRHFGSDPAVLNKQLVVNGTSLTIVGVARAGFAGVQVGQTPDIFIPITMKAQVTPNDNGLADRTNHWIAVIGRLKPGMSVKQAEASLVPGFRAILASESTQLKMSPPNQRKFLDRRILLAPGAHGRPILQKDAGEPLLILAAMVGLVLLIACANLASLLVARGEARQREIAVRLAMGASRWRLMRQLLTENLLLGVAGGAAGLALASWMLSGFVAAIPESIGALGLEAKLDYRLLAFAAALSIFTAILFGFTPALRATRADLQSTLKDQGANTSGGKSNVRLRKWLMVSQVALTAVLLAGAGFFGQSLMNLKHENLGLRADHVIEFSIAPELNRYSPPQTIAAGNRIRDAIAALQGVQSVSAARVPVLAQSSAGLNITAEGYSAKEDEDTDVAENWVGPNYFATLGTPLLAGREFRESDSAKSPKVAVINETFARRFFAGRNPIGMRIAFGAGNGVHPDIEIVGVVKNSKHMDVRSEIRPFLYTPYAQSTDLGQLTFYVRTAADPLAMAATLRKTVETFDPSLPVFQLKALTEQVDEIVFSDRLLTFFSLCLALLAALLAAVGLYGVMAYVVARRTREIGIRMALGATQTNVSWLVLREVIRMSAAGLAAGLVAAYAIGRLIESQLFGVKASEPAVFLVAASVLASVALVAGWLPAHQAASVDPMIALRHE